MEIFYLWNMEKKVKKYFRKVILYVKLPKFRKGKVGVLCCEEVKKKSEQDRKMDKQTEQTYIWHT